MAVGGRWAYDTILWKKEEGYGNTEGGLDLHHYTMAVRASERLREMYNFGIIDMEGEGCSLYGGE